MKTANCHGRGWRRPRPRLDSDLAGLDRAPSHLLAAALEPQPQTAEPGAVYKSLEPLATVTPAAGVGP